MGDVLKISKDKRHKSSSSLSEGVLEGTRSERKLDIKASIPEGEDQFTTAELRCDRLQEKIDLVKELKKKKKFRKRSLTHVTEQPIDDNIPFIRVRTMPKKKVSQHAARLRRAEVVNPARGGADPTLAEQRRMLSLVSEQANRDQQPKADVSTAVKASRGFRRAQADGDTCPRVGGTAHEVACGDDEDSDQLGQINIQTPRDIRKATNYSNYRRQTIRGQKQGQDDSGKAEQAEHCVHGQAPRRKPARNHNAEPVEAAVRSEERPVVELFNKSRAPDRMPYSFKNTRRESPLYDDQETGPLENIKSVPSHQRVGGRRRTARRSHRYELPTLSSQLKQTNMRYYYEQVNNTNIPFIVSKSTTPSHNIGVNLQQVLNGVKIQQPLSGIPLTIAHHMGLRHVSTALDMKAVKKEPELDMREINVIKVGRKFVRLPSYKCISYNRLLALYREGDGVVPRFLRAVSRPHYFYTSMYNLTDGREEFEGSTSKGFVGGGSGSLEAKKSLKEYAALYREYEQLEQRLRRGAGHAAGDCQQRRNELARELAAREDHIRRIVQDFQSSGEQEPSPLRASFSNAEDGCRHSTFKLCGDAPPPMPL